MKTFLIICDGLGDRPIAQFDSQTPLEAAYTPNLDKLAEGGVTGVMHTVDIGVRPGSDTAHLALFGYDPNVYYPGRGPLEVAGIGMEIKPGDICFRANMATVDDDMIVKDRRAGRIGDASPFAEKLNGIKIDGVEFLAGAGTGHRLGLIMRGPGLSPQLTDVDSKKVGVKARKFESADKSREAKFTAEVLNKFLEQAHLKLNKMELNRERVSQGKLPANYLLVRGAGIFREVPSFYDKYGLKAACVAGGGLYKGIAGILGMDVVAVEGATGKPDTDIKAKINKAIELGKEYNFVFVHIKGADTMGEDGDPEGKKKFIEKIDEAMAPMLNLTDSLVVVTADHSTPCVLKNHSADDVPVLISGESVRHDDVKQFGERPCAKGRLGHIRGSHLMPIIIDLMGLAKMFGA